MRRKAIAAAIGAAAAYAVLQRWRQADLQGQVALVTGGSRGLGFVLARELGRAGCRVAICGRDQAQLQRAAGALSKDGLAVLPIPCDVAEEGQVREMVSRVRQEWGPIDILVNNAGIIEVAPIQQLRTEDYRRAMDIMFWGLLHAIMAVLPDMRQRRSGRIVNITSIGGAVSVPHLGSYAAAKFAAVGFSEGLSAELARDGIRVTTVLPGLMRTGSHLHAEFLEPQHEQYRLFAPMASLPLISMDAERAARRIVAAVRRGEPEVILSLPANVLARVHGLMPGTTTRILGLFNRWLPMAPTAERGSAMGYQLEPAERSLSFKAVTVLGRDAARRFLQRDPASTEAS